MPPPHQWILPLGRSMRDLLLVGCGGFIGSAIRFWIGGIVTQATSANRFPLATLVVNVTGCLAIGLLGGLAETRHVFSPAARLLLFTGLLGGFTTFSAFGFETMFLAREGAWRDAVLNIVLQLVLGLGAVWLGYRAALLASN